MMIEGDRKVMTRDGKKARSLAPASSRFCWSCTKSWVGLAFRVQAKESPFLTRMALLCSGHTCILSSVSACYYCWIFWTVRSECTSSG